MFLISMNPVLNAFTFDSYILYTSSNPKSQISTNCIINGLALNHIYCNTKSFDRKRLNEVEKS